MSDLVLDLTEEQMKARMRARDFPITFSMKGSKIVLDHATFPSPMSASQVTKEMFIVLLQRK